ncbi:2431_t:CDS:2 [Dentiscutata erythropus]|uniref:2431_t:CDS:1 n=1 Tax=Dentiscutata erythropus TaxID=1348616 RepID=A0A9N9IHR8_9GLOM|nr:2431_t:CDS:2 [Dentiscutata erythropus]
MIDNEVLGLIVPLTPSIDLSEPPHYWIDHVKNVIAFFMKANDDKRRAIHAEINDETLFKIRGDYEYNELEHEIKRDFFLVQGYLYCDSRILQAAQRFDMNLTSTNFPPTLVPSNKFADNPKTKNNC